MSSPIRSESCSGPIGWAQPSTMPWSMSSLEAKPDSYMRIADSRYGISNALTTKPARSWESMHCLPSVSSANLRTASTVSGSVMIEVTSSTSGSTGTGLKKCMPSTRPGCLVSAPSFMIGTDEVLEARNCASGSSSSRRRKTSRLSCSFSITASIARVDAREVLEGRRSRRADPAPPPAPPRSACRSARRAPVSARSWRASAPRARRRPRRTVTSTPDRAQTSAIPEPMRPPPMTPTRMAQQPSTCAFGRAACACGSSEPDAAVAVGYAASAGGTGMTQTQFADGSNPAGPSGRRHVQWRPAARPPRRPYGHRAAAPTESHPRARRCRRRRTCSSQCVRQPGRLLAGPITIPLQPATFTWRIEQSRGPCALEESPDIAGRGGR